MGAGVKPPRERRRLAAEDAFSAEFRLQPARARSQPSAHLSKSTFPEPRTLNHLAP